MQEPFQRLERLSRRDAEELRLAGYRCQQNIPETCFAPGTLFCDKPIAFKARQKHGDLITWWYSCEDCAAPIMKAIGVTAL